MKISIITVSYNSEKTISRTIDSVFNQTYKDIEYIIIDGASSDNTLKILEQNKDKITKIISEKDNGIYDAMNKGIDNATGDYLFFLNSDDYLYNETVIANIFKTIKNKKTDIIYGDLICRNNETNTLRVKKQNKRLNKIYLLKNVPCQPTMFFKKDTFDKVGKFNTNHKIVSDLEWILKAFLINKVTSEYIPIAINVFSTGGISTSKEYDELHAKERNEILDIYFTKKERVSFDIISKYFRSLTDIPIISPILNLFFKFKY